ncbi:hypothetical protein [Halovulum sp. GXIMD14793]
MTHYIIQKSFGDLGLEPKLFTKRAAAIEHLLTECDDGALYVIMVQMDVEGRSVEVTRDVTDELREEAAWAFLEDADVAVLYPDGGAAYADIDQIPPFVVAPVRRALENMDTDDLTYSTPNPASLTAGMLGVA